MKTLAATTIDFGTFSGFGRLGDTSKIGNGINIFSNVISTAVGIMTIVAFIWFVFNLIMGAIGIMTAGGDKAQLENSRKKITNGVIGLIVVIAALFIVQLVGTLLGIDILNLPLLFGQVSKTIQ